MQTKLTLRMDDRLIANAKEYAASVGKSLSQLVAEYFAANLSATAPRPSQTPRVTKLRGSLKDSGIDADDYLNHLEEKHF